MGDEALALACSTDRFYSAANCTNTVQSYSMEDGSSEGAVMRFTADPSCADVTPDGSLVAAGAEDMTVKVLRSEEGEVITLEGHEAPVLSVAIDTHPERKFVVSSSCDGTVRIWRISDDGIEVKSIHGLLAKCADVSTAATRVSVAWRPPDGSAFAVASPERVVVYARDTWESTHSFSIPGEAESGEVFTTLAWSSDGSHLAAATSKGAIDAWGMSSSGGGKAIAALKTGRAYAVTALAFNPKKKGEAAFIDDHGWWGVLENLVEIKGTEEAKAERAKEKDQEIMDEDELTKALFEDDEDDENSFSIRQIKRDTGFLSDEENSNLLPPGEAGEKGEGGSSAAPSPMPPPPPPVQPAPQFFEPDLQDHFQPSSTPSRLTSYFMVWNSVGVVRCINGGEGDDSAIEVEFHDTSVHHPVHISNALGHVMADLSASCLALACEADEDGLAPSRVVVHHFADQV